MTAYNPLKHRHTPEIIEKAKLIGEKDLKINFVPHLIPVTRGMLVSVYVTLESDIDAKSVLKSSIKMKNLYEFVTSLLILKIQAEQTFVIFLWHKMGEIYL